MRIRNSNTNCSTTDPKPLRRSILRHGKDGESGRYVRHKNRRLQLRQNRRNKYRCRRIHIHCRRQ